MQQPHVDSRVIRRVADEVALAVLTAKASDRLKPSSGPQYLDRQTLQSWKQRLHRATGVTPGDRSAIGSAAEVARRLDEEVYGMTRLTQVLSDAASGTIDATAFSDALTALKSGRAHGGPAGETAPHVASGVQDAFWRAAVRSPKQLVAFARSELKNPALSPAADLGRRQQATEAHLRYWGAELSNAIESALSSDDVGVYLAEEEGGAWGSQVLSRALRCLPASRIEALADYDLFDESVQQELESVRMVNRFFDHLFPAAERADSPSPSL